MAEAGIGPGQVLGIGSREAVREADEYMGARLEERLPA
jgi:hypothetical protein